MPYFCTISLAIRSLLQYLFFPFHCPFLFSFLLILVLGFTWQYSGIAPASVLRGPYSARGGAWAPGCTPAHCSLPISLSLSLSLIPPPYLSISIQMSSFHIVYPACSHIPVFCLQWYLLSWRCKGSPEHSSPIPHPPGIPLIWVCVVHSVLPPR